MSSTEGQRHKPLALRVLHHRDGGIRTRDPLNPMLLLHLRDFNKLLNLRAVLGIGVEVQGPSGALCCEKLTTRTHNKDSQHALICPVRLSARGRLNRLVMEP
jgi:hypothetical protein